MFFNPLFIQINDSNNLPENNKANKFNNSNYLFADIINITSEIVSSENKSSSKLDLIKSAELPERIQNLLGNLQKVDIEPQVNEEGIVAEFLGTDVNLTEILKYYLVSLQESGNELSHQKSILPEVSEEGIEKIEEVINAINEGRLYSLAVDINNEDIFIEIKNVSNENKNEIGGTVQLPVTLFDDSITEYDFEFVKNSLAPKLKEELQQKFNFELLDNGEKKIDLIVEKLVEEIQAIMKESGKTDYVSGEVLDEKIEQIGNLLKMNDQEITVVKEALKSKLSIINDQEINIVKEELKPKLSNVNDQEIKVVKEFPEPKLSNIFEDIATSKEITNRVELKNLFLEKVNNHNNLEIPSEPNSNLKYSFTIKSVSNNSTYPKTLNNVIELPKSELISQFEESVKASKLLNFDHENVKIKTSSESIIFKLLNAEKTSESNLQIIKNDSASMVKTKPENVSNSFPNNESSNDELKKDHQSENQKQNKINNVDTNNLKLKHPLNYEQKFNSKKPENVSTLFPNSESSNDELKKDHQGENQKQNKIKNFDTNNLELKHQLNYDKKFNSTESTPSITEELITGKTVKLSAKPEFVESDGTDSEDVKIKESSGEKIKGFVSQESLNSNKQNQANAETDKPLLSKMQFQGDELKTQNRSINIEQVYKKVNIRNINNEIAHIIQNGEKKIVQLQLTPENLGRVEVKLELVNKVINATINVENETVQHIVQNSLEGLKLTLNQNGVQFNSLNVSLSTSDERNQKFYKQKRNRNHVKNIFSVEGNNDAFESKKLGYNTYDFIA